MWKGFLEVTPFLFCRWRLVIHGGIDGYSRLVVYLKCSDNNRAETVGNSFLAATEEYCWPSRVRTNKGGENAVVARLMIERRGEGRGSILQGSSVHNQRIERLWRDMRKMVSEYYRRLFYFLESHLLLYPIGEVDLFSLHFVFIPRINNSLSQFRASWNNHKLSTEGQKTPNQLYEEILNEILWNNRFIRINNYSVYYKAWHVAGVEKIGDQYLSISPRLLLLFWS